MKLNEPPYWNDADGRKGIDLQLSRQRYTKWMTYGIYYDTEDHGIPFVAGCPELALFVDTDPKDRVAFKKNPRFIGCLSNLEKLGWEENLIKSRTDNEWRLLWWRKPLSQLPGITLHSLREVLSSRLVELAAQPEFYKHYLAQPALGADLA